MGAIRNLWLKWKMLRLPWRKKFFVGQDLSGNTFWEFRDPLNPLRLRRIVHQSPYVRSSASGSHYADIPITPQWHQWLRQARLEAPTLSEQQSDIARQVMLKENARLADLRWSAQGRIEGPAGGTGGNGGGRGEERTTLASDTRAATERLGVETRDTKRDATDGAMSAVDDVVEVPGPPTQATPRTKAQTSDSRPEHDINTETQTPNSTPTSTGSSNSFEPEPWSPGPSRRRR